MERFKIKITYKTRFQIPNPTKSNSHMSILKNDLPAEKPTKSATVLVLETEVTGVKDDNPIEQSIKL